MADPSAAPVAVPEGLRRFGDYELLEEIARGGMGIVYRARQLSLNRTVALKLILAGEFASAGFVRRFRNEAQAAARLRHPNIVTIHEVGEQDGQQFFAMEFVDGPNFAQLVREGPLPARRAATYLRTVADAIAQMHAQGILHRDLKPSNILLDPFDQPRVTDFGLARQLQANSDLTLSGQALGSPGYMSPEQALGRQAAVGVASDLYSLGAVLYHLLTGRPPFQADSVHAVLRQVETAEPVSPRRLNPSVPVDLETICLKCLEKEPSRRYPTAQALREELDRFLRGESIQARPIGLPARAWRWCQRRPGIAALGVALLAALVAGGGGVLWQWRRAEIAQIIAATTDTQNRTHSYSTDVQAASEAVERGLFADARRLLAKHLPAPGQPDERGFEWRFLWHRSEGQQQATLTKHTTTVCGVAVSPDGHWAASTGMDGQLCLWNLSTLQLHTNLALGGVGWFVEFAPDSARLLSSSGADRTAVWSIPDLALLRELTGSRGSVAGPAPLLASFTVNPFLNPRPAPIEIWNYDTGEPVANVPEPGRAVALSPDGRLVAVGLVNSNVVVREVASGRLRATLATRAEAFQLRFSPDGTQLAVAGWDKAVRVWNLGGLAGQPTSDHPTHSPSPSTDLVALSTATRADTVLDEGHWLKTWAVAFSPDGRRLASTSSDRSVRVWDARTLAPLELLNGHADEVWCVAWTPDGRRLVTGGKDGLVMVWETGVARTNVALPHRPRQRPWLAADGTAILTHPDHDGPSGPALWSADGRRLDRWPAGHTFIGLSADSLGAVEFDETTGALNFWSPDAGEPTRRVRLDSFTGGPPPVSRGVGLSAEGRTFFAIRTNGVAQIWEAATGRNLRRFHMRVLPLVCARLSPDARWLAASPDYPYEAYLYETGTGSESVLRGHTEFVKGLTFSPDSRRLATAGVDGRIKLWETATGALVQTLFGHWQSVDDVAFTPDGRTLASIETRAGVKLWRLDTFREVAAIPLPEAGEHLAFSPAGDRLWFVQVDGAVSCLAAPEVP